MKKFEIFFVIGILLILALPISVNALLWSSDSQVVLYWDLDEAGDLDNATDLVDGSRNGTLNNVAQGATRGPGIINNGWNPGTAAAYFNGSNDLFAIGAEDSFSLQIWANTSNTGADAHVMTEGSNSDNVPYWSISSQTGAIVFEIRGDGGGNIKLTSGKSFYNSKPQHVVVTKSGNTYKLYVNGTLEDTDTGGAAIGAITLDTFAVNYWIRAAPENGLGTDTTYDEIGIWNKTLNQAAVTSLYNGGSGLAYGTEVTGVSVNVTGPLNNSNFTSSSISFNYTFLGGDYDSCWYTGLGESNNSPQVCGTNWTFDVGPGNHTFTVWINDTDGNMNYSNVSFEVLPFFVWNETFNSTGYETMTQTFNMNTSYLTANYTITANLTYMTHTATGFTSNRSFAATKVSDANGFAYFEYNFTAREADVSTGENSFYWVLNLDDGSTVVQENETTHNQSVNSISLGLCNASLTTEFIYIIFNDSETLAGLNASIDSSTWEYWLGDGSVKKTMYYSNSTVNNNYSFCFGPINDTLNVDLDMVYSNLTNYPARSTSQTLSLNSSSETLQLYLIPLSGSDVVSLVIQDVMGNPISSATITAERQFEGAWVTLGTFTSDDTGTITTSLNSDYNHRFTISHPDYITEILIIRPTQSVYTIQLTATTTEGVYNSSLDGIVYWKSPASGTFLTPGNVYNFTFDIIANLSNLVNYTFRLVDENDNILNQTSGSNAAGGNISFTFNSTSNYSYIYTKYYIDIGNGLFQIDPSIFPILETYVGNSSILKWFQDMRLVETSEDRFGELFWFFFILFVGTASFTMFTGAELTSPGICIPLILMVTWIASIAGFLTVNINPSPDALFINQYAGALMMTLLSAGYGLGLVNKT